MTPYDLQFVQRLSALKAGLMSQGASSVEATQRALGMLYATLQQQANVLAYLDDFRLMAATMLAIIPLAVMIKRIKTHRVVGH